MKLEDLPIYKRGYCATCHKKCGEKNWVALSVFQQWNFCDKHWKEYMPVPLSLKELKRKLNEKD